jgi:hypothetical protein
VPDRRRLAIKVHRVISPEEITALEELGVDYVGLDVDDDAFLGIDPEPFWKDDRYVTEEHVGDLLPRLRRARGFVELPEEELSAAALARLAAKGVDLLQVQAWNALPRDVAGACAETGLGLIYDRLYVEPEDEGAFYDLVRPDRPCLAFYDLQVFPTYGDAWGVLTGARGEVTLGDVDALARRASLFVSLNATRANVEEIVRTLTPLSVAGLSFTLSSSDIATFHTFEFDELVAILEAIRSLSPA